VSPLTWEGLMGNTPRCIPVASMEACHGPLTERARKIMAPWLRPILLGCKLLGAPSCFIYSN
jgi:hypothetical protein